MGAAGRHRQVALGGTQPPEMPPNLSQPLGMPPKPRRNARIGWEASAHETSLERADSAPCLRTWRSYLVAPRATFPGWRPAPKPRWVKDTALESCCLAESLESLIFIQNIDHLTTGKSKSSNRSQGNSSPC